MQTTTQSSRQERGCGYEPLVPLEKRRKLWRPRAFIGPEPTLCAAYTTALPEVRELASIHAHWSKGSAGELSDATKAGVELLDQAELVLIAWLRKPKKDGGGGA